MSRISTQLIPKLIEMPKSQRAKSPGSRRWIATIRRCRTVVRSPEVTSLPVEALIPRCMVSSARRAVGDGERKPPFAEPPVFNGRRQRRRRAEKGQSPRPERVNPLRCTRRELRDGIRQKREIEKVFEEKAKKLQEVIEPVRASMRNRRDISKDIKDALSLRNKERNLGIVRLETSQRYNALKAELKRLDDVEPGSSAGPSKRGQTRPLADRLRDLRRAERKAIKESLFGKNEATAARRRTRQHKRSIRKKRAKRKHEGPSYRRRAELRKRKFGLVRTQSVVRGRRRRAPPSRG